MTIYESNITKGNLKEVEKDVRSYFNKRLTENHTSRYRENCMKLDYHLASIYFNDFEVEEDCVIFFINNQEVGEITFDFECMNISLEITKEKDERSNTNDYYIVLYDEYI